MSPRLLLCLLLACASGPLLAHECKRLAADSGGGGSSDQSAADAREDDRAGNAVAAARTGAARPGSKAVKASAPRGNGGNDGIGEIRPPRWHSFLPGMFR